MTDLEQRSGWLGRLSQWGVGLLFCLLSFIALVLGVVVWWKNGWYWLTALTGLAVAAAAAVCCWKGAILAPLAERYWRPLTALALLLCLVVKSGWILTHAITPQSDYATFHNLASALADRGRDIFKYLCAAFSSYFWLLVLSQPVLRDFWHGACRGDLGKCGAVFGVLPVPAAVGSDAGRTDVRPAGGAVLDSTAQPDGI